MAAYRQTRVALPMISPAVLVIIVTCVLVFILQSTALGQVIATNLALSLAGLTQGRIWTVLTFGLLHGDFMHLFFNMLMLFFLGPRLEHRLGTQKFVAFYALSGLVAGLAFCIWVFLTGAVNVWVVGASGSLFGIYAMWALLWPEEHLLVWGLIPIKVKWLMLILVGGSVFMLATGGGAVAHQAHLGGALGGLIWWYFTERRPPPRPPRRGDRGARRRMRIVKKTENDRFSDIVGDLDD